MTDSNGGLGDWTMIFLVFVASPVVSFFVADSVVTAHNLDELFGVPLWLAMMTLCLASTFALDGAVAERRTRRRQQRRGGRA